ncbi:MAG TPA: DUF2071 domain-containing protein [Terriglobia bacterium]|nr:DUF2071 domain-containing protein [Terriglobia bacterium]
MSWHNLLFMHWPVSPDLLRPLIPPALELDTFDNQAWLGIVPFTMTNVRPRWFPEFLGSAFPEINLRTYARRGHRSGVWFFSLDAADWLAVWAARRAYHLPYWLAEMSAEQVSGWTHFKSRRAADPGVKISCRYRPTGPPFRSLPGSLEYWLTERYCLFSANRRGGVFVGEIHHRPWPLQPAEVELTENTMAGPIGATLPASQPLLHYAERLDVVAWGLERAELFVPASAGRGANRST